MGFRSQYAAGVGGLSALEPNLVLGSQLKLSSFRNSIYAYESSNSLFILSIQHHALVYALWPNQSSNLPSLNATLPEPPDARVLHVLRGRLDVLLQIL